MKQQASYKDAGVDIALANTFVKRIRPLLKLTQRKEVMSAIGGFGGLFHFDAARYKHPVLVSSTDGVGTKLKIAQQMDIHDTVGVDLVAMSVNDVVVQGAEPLFFLDYIATGKIHPDKLVAVVGGVVKGCQEAGCSLIGGETAEMPGFYKEDEYDLAGFCVGAVEEDRIIDGSLIRVGDRIIGIASNGLHSNGFSLVRKVLLEGGRYSLDRIPEGLDAPLGETLLRPTRIYVKPLLNVLKNFSVRGLVHITGGGFVENIPRVIPGPCRAVIRRGSWPVPPIFSLLQKAGNIDDAEMFLVFNMGIGMMAVVPEKEAPEVLDRLQKLGESAYLIGSVEKREERQPRVDLV